MGKRCRLFHVILFSKFLTIVVSPLFKLILFLIIFSPYSFKQCRIYRTVQGHTHRYSQFYSLLFDYYHFKFSTKVLQLYLDGQTLSSFSYFSFFWILDYRCILYHILLAIFLLCMFMSLFCNLFLKNYKRKES